MTERLGDAPIEEASREKMNRLAALIDEFFNGDLRGEDRQTGFCLMIFPFEGFDGRANYISNASRADVVTLSAVSLIFTNCFPRAAATFAIAWLA